MPKKTTSRIKIPVPGENWEKEKYIENFIFLKRPVEKLDNLLEYII
jgi:hypothetical protein